MAEIEFWKMHGLGNDYIVIDGWRHRIQGDRLSRMAELLCRRRFSVGADGLILAESPHLATADVRMRIFNADGSEAEMCGNGIRCLAKFVYENKIRNARILNVETLAGLKKVELRISGERVTGVKVDMETPSFNREDLPMIGEGPFIDEILEVSGFKFKASCVSVGNPHCVIFVEDVDGFPVDKWGPLIEKHRLFPRRVNVEFAEIVGRNEVKVRTWERGCGETLACGTGACAVSAVANKLGLIGREAEIILTGGTLKVAVERDSLIMEGPAVKVYEGILSDEVLNI
ncbi:MAG: diaminopimelate epimerase [Candidatus Bathyarchaeia archaeon]